MTLSIPDDFLTLPPEDQRRIRLEIEQTARYAYDHVVPIAISPPPSANLPDRLRTASGFLLRLDGRMYLGTADHVWAAFLDRLSNGEAVNFQAGPVLVNPSREVRREHARDIAFIELSDREVERFPYHVATAMRGWPPPLPKDGSFALLSGCPEYNRDHDTQSHVGVGLLTLLVKVVSTNPHMVVCEYNRESCIVGPNPPPPNGTNLSGLSGGPVFALGEIAISLFGLVSYSSGDQDKPDGPELVWVRTFDDCSLLEK